MQKVLSILISVSFLAFLVVPVLVSAVGECGNCATPPPTPNYCDCGANVLTKESGLYCYNGTVYNSLSACQVAMGAGGSSEGYQEAPTIITSGGELVVLIDKIANWIFTILLAVAGIMLILAGFWWITAGGNPENVKRASDMLRNALIGVAIALGAKGLVAVIKSILGP